METAVFPPSIPAEIQKLLDKMIKELNPVRIILFGSRARGDYQERSDIDIALVLDEGTYFDDGEWIAAIDIVNFNKAPQSLKENINKEGRIVYERPA